MIKHDDPRRLLIETEEGLYKVCKVAVLKERAVLGNHFHRNKDERFLLVQGHAYRVAIGNSVALDLDAPNEWFVPRGAEHAFDLAAGSILVGLATEPYDKDDETRASPAWLSLTRIQGG